MSNLIHFPHARENIKARQANSLLKYSSPDIVQNTMMMGPWEYSCPKCKTVSKFDCKNMIFRTFDFYCSSCGALHRVSNPAFTSK